MVSEMMREAVEGIAAANAGKSEKAKSTEGYWKREEGAEKVHRGNPMEEPGRPEGTERAEAPQGNYRQYTVSQRKSEVSSQYRESVSREQNFWLEYLGLEEETNGKEEDDPKSKNDEMKEQLESLQRMLERLRESRERWAKQQKKNQPKKKCSYSYRRVSAVISGAKTTLQASLALSTATANLSMVKRMSASGQYDKRDIGIAIAHAQKMVRTARKKYNNIKFEANQKNVHKSIENNSKQKVAKIYRPPSRQKAQRELQRLQTLLKTQENQEKARNRRREDMELMMADMQYIRRKIELLKMEQTNNEMAAKSFVMNVQAGGEELVSSAVKMENLGMAEQAVDAQAGAEAATEGGGRETAFTPVAAPEG